MYHPFSQEDRNLTSHRRGTMREYIEGNSGLRERFAILRGSRTSRDSDKRPEKDCRPFCRVERVDGSPRKANFGLQTLFQPFREKNKF
ncbi:unnamed protein product [Phytomonas sp. EM1]|nr:unnamed protein product [Phytomonas sp. EM1]|eukprot:CCW59955.1 unnamed protein product [Phytomonas sp. isolate EM1]